jgi:predicted metal-dependent hydrolase
MAFKTFMLGDQPITVYKRRSSRSLRLSLAADGKVKVSIPVWAPYRAGVEFARSRQAWIEEQRKPPTLLVTGQPIGKAHHLRFVADRAKTAPSGRVSSTEITITYPASMAPSAPAVQAAAEKAAIRALRNQAESLLPQRLKTLSEERDLPYNSVSIKRLKGRWGSCDQHKNIVLNLFLLQLPWDLIDYVLLHELAHTKVLRHGPDFWHLMEQILPDVKQRRKRLRGHQPVVNSPAETLMS